MTASEVVIAFPGDSEAWWSEGTRSEILVPAASTGSEVSVLRELLPARSGPPLHRHPEEETYVVLSGRLDVWLHPGTHASASWWRDPGVQGYRCGPHQAVTVPGGVGHCYRVSSDDPVDVLVVSRPSGLEDWTRAMGMPAIGPGLPPEGAIGEPPSRAEAQALARRLRVDRLGDPVPDVPAAGAGLLQVVTAIDGDGIPVPARVWFVLSGAIDLAQAGEETAVPAGSVVVTSETVAARSAGGAQILGIIGPSAGPAPRGAG